MLWSDPRILQDDPIITIAGYSNPGSVQFNNPSYHLLASYLKKY